MFFDVVVHVDMAHEVVLAGKPLPTERADVGRFVQVHKTLVLFESSEREK